MLVKNLNGTGSNFPSPTCKCNSWIDHWIKNKHPDKKYSKYICRGCDVKKIPSELVGGHVQKVNDTDKKYYIVPLCSSCKNTKDKEFKVNSSDLISAKAENCKAK
ncbi:MAG: hypothetical protein WBG30_10250 [Psychrilyobacter sp.]|uniref:hypothetical protein n=1 Tax=Psychrilyobacter sp. TaxID=2586924 RepID=UPI003C784DE7